MKDIKELVKKPSDVVTAMVKGLLRQNEREDFKINMNAFGIYSTSENICFGCAATSTVCELTKVPLDSMYLPNVYGQLNYAIGNNSELIDRTGLLLGYEGVSRFETAVDYLRRGDIFMLLVYFGFDNALSMSVQLRKSSFLDFYLETGNWCCQLDKVLKLRDELVRMGL